MGQHKRNQQKQHQYQHPQQNSPTNRDTTPNSPPSADPANIDTAEVILSDSSPVAEPESGPSPTAQVTPEPPVEAAPVPNPAIPAIPAAPPSALPANTDISAFLSGLSPDQLAKIRSLAAAKGLSTGPQRGPHGGLMVTIEIPAEACEPLQTWAEEAGTSFTEFVGQVAGDAITNYCFGDWGATRVEPVAPVAAAPVTAATT